MNGKVHLKVVGEHASPAKREPSTAKLKLLAEVTEGASSSIKQEEKVTPGIIRDFLDDEYKRINFCPVVQKALNRIHKISVFKDRTQISFSPKGNFPIPQNILNIISRDVKQRFFKDNRIYHVQCINLKSH